MWPLPCYPSKNGLEIHARSEKKNQIDHVQVGVKLQTTCMEITLLANQKRVVLTIEYNIEVVVM